MNLVITHASFFAPYDIEHHPIPQSQSFYYNHSSLPYNLFHYPLSIHPIKFNNFITMRLAGTFLFSVLAIAAGSDAKIFGKDKREFSMKRKVT
jgi:hypothetical protein